MYSNEDEWQRNTNDPSSQALRGFIEADVEEGLRLLAELSSQRDAITVLSEISIVHAEVSRFIARAREGVSCSDLH